MPPSLTPLASATFACDRCGRRASTITLLPPGAADPQAPGPGQPAHDAGYDATLRRHTRLSIDGPIHVTQTFFEDGGIDVAGVRAALLVADSASLWRLDHEYAPAWCPDCERNYCEHCWVVWPEYDEVFYDCTRGRCPAGHQRILDD